MNRLFSFAILLRGAIAVIAQALLVRELLVVFYGNELTFGIILSSWLLTGALGSILAAYLYQRTRQPLVLFGILQLFCGVWLVIAVALVRSSRLLLGVPFGEVLSLGQTVLIALAGLSVSSFCDGAMFTIAYRNIRSVGRIYALECLGALSAGVLFSFVLLNAFTNVQIALLVWCAAALTAFLLFWGARKKFPAVLSFLLLCYGIACLVHAGALQEKTLATQWKGHNLIAYENSVYGNIAVTQEEEQRTVYYDGLPAASLPVPESTFTQDFIHLPMLAAARPLSALFLGNAAGGLLEEAEKYPLESIVYAETDPRLIGVLEGLGIESVTKELTDKRLTLEFTDGRNYLKNSRRRFDIIFVNTGLPVSLTINRYYTKEFFIQLKNHLSDDGIAVFKTWGSLSYLSRELAAINASLIKTASQAFTHVEVVPGDGHNIFIASQSPVRLEAALLAQRMHDLGITASLLNPVYLDLRLDPAYAAWFRQSAGRAMDKVCVNQDLAPCGLYDGLALYYAQFSKELPQVFSGFRRISPQTTFLAVLVFMLAWSLRTRHPDARGPILGFTVLSSGFFAMGLQVSVIFLFQSFLGYIFQWLAVLTAAFMTGASAGAFLSLRAAKGTASFRQLGRVECAAATLTASLSFFVIRFVESQAGPAHLEGWLFGLISASGGLLIGMELPLVHEIACGSLKASREQCERSAGWIYGLDLAGACAGALAAPLLLIPSCGIGHTILLLWIIKVLNGGIVLKAGK
ncbi:MAG: hypothetical protein PHH75_03365 [Candidatus Omnitrophica bacterium]|nr:hypothetical protein [Candidatus Omnitrophota bacterium]